MAEIGHMNDVEFGDAMNRLHLLSGGGKIIKAQLLEQTIAILNRCIVCLEDDCYYADDVTAIQDILNKIQTNKTP